jgi:hypothetical protein
MANQAVQPKTLYPRKDTVEEAVQYISAQLPITSNNELTAALALYHNSLLHELQEEAND